MKTRQKLNRTDTLTATPHPVHTCSIPSSIITCASPWTHEQSWITSLQDQVGKVKSVQAITTRPVKNMLSGPNMGAGIITHTAPESKHFKDIIHIQQQIPSRAYE
eukprot:1160278-Pelagomonas_calceolata.AAC.2